MRITSSMIQRESIGTMQRNLRGLAEAQRQVGSGLRIGTASDDPAGASASMRTRGSLRALDQYQRNISAATSRATTEAGVLDQLGDVLVRAKELALSQGGSNASATSRAATRAEVDELLNHAVQLGNTRFGEQFLFGGQLGTQPFDAARTGFVSLDPDGVPMVPQGAQRTEIASGHYVTATHDGKEVFLDSGALQALRDLSDALSSGDPVTAIASALHGIDGAYSQVQNLVSEVGARTNQLEDTAASLESLSFNLETLRADLEEVDVEVAATELVTRQTAYQAAMLATSRVIGVTLADYLR